MGEPEPDVNSTQYNGDGIHCSLLNDEGVLPFVSLIINWDRNQASRRYPNHIVHSFRKSSHILQR